MKKSKNSIFEKIMKIEAHIQMEENKDLVALLKRISQLDFKLNQKVTEERILENTQSKELKCIEDQCQKREEEIRFLKEKLRRLNENEINFEEYKAQKDFPNEAPYNFSKKMNSRIVDVVPLNELKAIVYFEILISLKNIFYKN